MAPAASYELYGGQRRKTRKEAANRHKHQLSKLPTRFSILEHQETPWQCPRQHSDLSQENLLIPG